MAGCEMPSTKPNGSAFASVNLLERNSMDRRVVERVREIPNPLLKNSNRLGGIAIDQERDIGRLLPPGPLADRVAIDVAENVGTRRHAVQVRSGKAAKTVLRQTQFGERPRAERARYHGVCLPPRPVIECHMRHQLSQPPLCLLAVVGQRVQHADAETQEAESTEDETLNIARLECCVGSRRRTEQREPIRCLFVAQRGGKTAPDDCVGSDMRRREVGVRAASTLNACPGWLGTEVEKAFTLRTVSRTVSSFVGAAEQPQGLLRLCRRRAPMTCSIRRQCEPSL